MKKIDLHFLTDPAARRKGVGMELAILVLLVVFAMSTLLVSTVMLEENNLDRQKAQLEQRAALDEIGEDFCAGTLEAAYDGYTVRVDDSNTTCVIQGEGATLTVKIEEGVVTQWTYGE